MIIYYSSFVSYLYDIYYQNKLIVTGIGNVKSNFIFHITTDEMLAPVGYLCVTHGW